MTFEHAAPALKQFVDVCGCKFYMCCSRQSSSDCRGGPWAIPPAPKHTLHQKPHWACRCYLKHTYPFIDNIVGQLVATRDFCPICDYNELQSVKHTQEVARGDTSRPVSANQPCWRSVLRSPCCPRGLNTKHDDCSSKLFQMFVITMSTHQMMRNGLITYCTHVNHCKAAEVVWTPEFWLMYGQQRGGVVNHVLWTSFAETELKYLLSSRNVSGWTVFISSNKNCIIKHSLSTWCCS